MYHGDNMKYKDYYEILGVKREATEAEINQLFVSLLVNIILMLIKQKKLKISSRKLMKPMKYWVIKKSAKDMIV